MNEKQKSDYWNSVFILIVLLVVVIIMGGAIQSTIKNVGEDKYCQSKGFEFGDWNLDIEEGYIECCSNIFKEHKKELECKVIEYEVKK